MQNTDKSAQEKNKSVPVNAIQAFSEKRALLVATVEQLKAKKNFVLLTLFLAALGTIFGHVFQLTTYTGTATLFVQAQVDPTAAEYLLNRQAAKLNKAERIETYMRYLNSDGFYLAVAQKLKYRDDFNQLNLSPPETASLFSFDFWKKRIWSTWTGQKSESTVKNESYKSSEIMELLKRMVSFETDMSRFVFIHAKTQDAQSAQVIANLTAEEFLNVTNERGIQEIEQIKNFVEAKMKETQDRLQSTEMELVEFKKKNTIISTDKSLNLVAERYSRISSDMEAAKLQLEENEKLIQFFESGKKQSIKMGAQQGPQVFGVKETTQILQKKLVQLRNEKAQIIAQEDGNQEQRIRDIDQEIQRTLKAYESYASRMVQDDLFQSMNPQKVQQKINELREENEILKNKISSLKSASVDVHSQIEKIPVLAQKQLFLENSIQLDSTNYTNLKNKLIELEIQRISQKKEVRLDQAAALPEPNRKGNLFLKLIFSALISLFLGVCLIIGIEALDPTIKHSSEFAEYNIEFIGEIPLIKAFSEQKTPEAAFEHPNKLICIEFPESAEAMSFKYVRARLEGYKYKHNKNNMVVSISSANVSEGKSLVCANLAVCVSQLKRRVLLIDADLRRPSQNGYFDVSPQYGLTDLAAMSKNLDEVILKNIYSNLDYLPAGFCSSNSTEIISSENFKALVHHLTYYYDYIIIDCPPVFAAVDAAIIASYSDMPILLANFRETKKVHLNEACNQLLRVSYKKVFGVINKTVLGTARFHYYGYHNYAKAENNLTPFAGNQMEAKDSRSFLASVTQNTSYGEIFEKQDPPGS